MLMLGRRVLHQPRRVVLPPAANGARGGGKWGNANRLSSTGEESGGDRWLPEGDTTLLHSIDTSGGSPPPPTAEWQQALAEKAGQLQYQYFNWRQDTRSDLQLFVFLNSLVYLFGALIQVHTAASWRRLERKLQPSLPSPCAPPCHNLIFHPATPLWHAELCHSPGGQQRAGAARGRGPAVHALVLPL